ncbi:MAG: hypothetical protein EOP04_16365, partial [Proteobacteria bacterium]
PGSAYIHLTGTSQATPMVVAVAALVWSYAPDLKPADVKKILLDNSDTEKFPKEIGGNRKLNAFKALSALQPKADLAALIEGATIEAVNGVYELNIKYTGPYSALKKVEVLKGTEVIGTSATTKVPLKLAYADTKLKFTVRITDSAGHTFVTKEVNVVVDVSKSLELTALDLSKHMGEINCQMKKAITKDNAETIFEAKVDKASTCDTVCAILLPLTYSSAYPISCGVQK